MPVHPHIRGVFAVCFMPQRSEGGPSPHTWGFLPSLHPSKTVTRSIPTYVGFSPAFLPVGGRWSVHPHIRGVFVPSFSHATRKVGPSPHTWGFRLGLLDYSVPDRSIPTYVGFSPRRHCMQSGLPVHPHIRGVFRSMTISALVFNGPSPHTWGFPPQGRLLRLSHRSIPTYVGFSSIRSFRLWISSVHPHIRGVFTEIKSKISRASSKTALLPAEKFKILFLVKIKSSAAAFQVHTIFRDQFPPGLHFEIALHL